MTEEQDLEAMKEEHDPPVRGRGVEGRGVGGFLDVHGREGGDEARGGVLRLAAPPLFAQNATAFRPDDQGTLWWMALTLDLLLRPNDLLKSLVRRARAAAGLHEPYVGLHVRHGDACGNNGRQCLPPDAIAPLVKRMCTRYQVGVVFVASDSPDVLGQLRQEAPELTWTQVPADTARAHGSGSPLLGQMWPQMLRTRMGLLDRQAVAELTFIDLLILADADFFVGQVTARVLERIVFMDNLTWTN